MDWHRCFGRLLIDLFTDSPFVVELEKDLSLKKQLLDVIILRKSEGFFAGTLPDGLEDLAAHNLISFKSHQETLDEWALKELIGHYVNYRKQVSPSMQQLLPETDFRLHAVTARFPQNLAGRVPWQERKPGVYDCRWGTDIIRVLVLRHLPEQEANAGLLVFSQLPRLVEYGRSHYHVHSPEASTLLYRVLNAYQQEGLEMPFIKEEFDRELRRELLEGLPWEERQAVLQKLSPEERQQVLQKLSSEERQQVLQKLSPEERQAALLKLSPEEILALLPREEIERYLKRINGTSPPPKGSGG